MVDPTNQPHPSATDWLDCRDAKPVELLVLVPALGEGGPRWWWPFEVP